MYLSEPEGRAKRHVGRRSSDSSSLDRQTVHESARFVFCIYYGIPIEGIHISDSSVEVRYSTEKAFNDTVSVLDYIKMIMSGAMTLQRILGEENHSFDTGISEARQLFDLLSSDNSTTYVDFDALISTCCKRANTHLADPKMRIAIGSVTRILARERADIPENMLRNLEAHTRAKLAG